MLGAEDMRLANSDVASSNIEASISSSHSRKLSTLSLTDTKYRIRSRSYRSYFQNLPPLVKQYLAGMQVEGQKVLVSWEGAKHCDANMEAGPLDGLDSLCRELLLFHGSFGHVREAILPGSTSAHFTHQSAIHTVHLSARLSVLAVNPPEDFDLDLLQVFTGL